MKTKEQIARDAADLIRGVGWVQEDFRRITLDGVVEGYCMYGAILEAAQAYQVQEDIVRARNLSWQIADEISKLLIGAAGVTMFNDTPGRTKEEVISVLERYAELKKESPDVEEA